MKKILYTMMAFAIATFALTSCEDVPCPYDIPSAGGDEPDPTPTEELLGTGTESDPYNVAAALDAASALESGATTSEKVYIKGVVTSVKECTAQYGNATFYLGDSSDATTTFYVYRCLGLGGNKITADDAVQVGDTIIVYGNVTNYNGTIETVQNDAYIYYSSRLGKGGSTSTETASAEAKGTGTLADPFNVAAAVAYVNKLGADVTSENEVYVKGKVLANNTTATTISSYGNMTFTIIDEGFEGTTFTAFQVYGPNKEKFTSVDQIKTGQTVVLCGKVVNYKGNTPETTGKGASYVVSIDGNSSSISSGDSGNAGGSTTGEVSGNAITWTISSSSVGGVASGTALTKITLSDGTILTFDAGGNSNGPKYYTTGGDNIRVYPKNTITINSTKKIASVVLNCQNYSSTDCVANKELTSSVGTPSCDGLTYTIAGVNSTSVVITNGCTSTGTISQLRFTSLVVNYADGSSAKRAYIRRK